MRTKKSSPLWRGSPARMRNIPEIKTLLVVLFLFVCLGSAFGTENNPSMERQTVRVGFFKFDGYHMLDSHGSRSGYGYSILQLLRQYTGWNYEYVGYESGWSHMLDMLDRGEIDLLTSSVKSPERMERFDFSDLPIGYSSTQMTVKAGCTKYRIGDYANWNGIRVGMLENNGKNDSFAAFAARKGFTWKRVSFDNIDELCQALQDEKIDAVVTGSLRRTSQEWVYEQIDVHPFYIIVKKGNRELLEQVDAALHSILIDSPGILNELFREYYMHKKDSGSELPLTESERAFIKNSQVAKRSFSVLVNPERAPFSSIDKNGNLTGIMADVLDRLTERTGLSFSLVQVSSRFEYTNYLESGHADVVLDLPHDHSFAEGEKYIITEPYLSSLISRIAKKSFPGEPRSIAVVSHSEMMEFALKKHSPGVRLVECRNTAEVVEAVSLDRADAGYLCMRTALEFLRRHPVPDLVIEPVPGAMINFTVGVSSSTDVRLGTIIAKTVRSFSKDEIQIASLGKSIHPGAMTFQEWISSHQRLIVSLLFGGVVLLAGTLGLMLSLYLKARRQKKLAESATADAVEKGEWFRLTLNAIGDGVITTDHSGRVIMINPVAERMLGCTLKDVVGRPHEDIFRIVRYDDEEPMPSPIARTLRTGMIVELANHTDLLSLSGRKYHISDSAAPILDNAGRIIGAILIFRDVTEQYNRNEKLRKTIVQMETGADMTDTATFEMELFSRKISGSKRLSEFWPIIGGVAAEPGNFVLPEDVNPLEMAMQVLLSGKSDDESMEYRSMRSGELHYYRLRIAVDDRKAGRISTVGVIQDVTEAKRREQELQNVLALWRIVMNTIPVLLFVKDAGNGFRNVLCNAAYAQLTGKRPEELIGMEDGDLFRDPELVKRCRRRNEEAMSLPDGLDYPETVIDHDGCERRYRTMKKPLLERGGRKLLVGIAVDITELSHRTECEKITSRVLLKILESSDLNEIWNCVVGNLQKHIMQCDHIILAKCNEDGLLRLEKEWHAAGTRSIREADLEMHYRLWDANIGLLRQNRVIRIPDLRTDPLTKSIRFGENYKTLSLIICAIFQDGRHWGSLLISSSNIIQEQNISSADEILIQSCGNAISLAVGRNSQQERLRASDQEKQMILDNLRTAVWLHDGKGSLIRCNSAAVKMIGSTFGNVVANGDREFFDSALSYASSGGRSPLSTAMTSGKSAQMELKRNGRDYIVSADPVFDKNGNLLYIIKSAVDVSKMNQMISQLHFTNFCLETFFKGMDLQYGFSVIGRELCRYLNAPRMLIIRLDQESDKRSLIFEYAEDGSPRFSHVFTESLGKNARWQENLLAGRMTVIPEVDSAEGREILGPRADCLIQYHVRTFLSFGIHDKENLWGEFAILWDREIHRPDEGELTLLNAMPPFIDLLLQRQLAHDALVNALETTRLAEQKKSELLSSQEAVTDCLKTLFCGNNEDTSVNIVLQKIISHLHATHVFMMIFDQKTHATYTIDEHAAPGFRKVFTGIKANYSSDEPWYTAFSSGRLIRLPELDSPASVRFTGCWNEIFRTLNVKSVYATGIFINKELVGDLGVAYCDGPFRLTELEENFLSNAGRFVALSMERNRSADEIRSALQMAQAADKAKSFFLASISHEIRTPLNAVIGFSDLLRQGGVPEAESKEYLDSIAHSANALLSLINDVLDLSKLEAGQMRIAPEPTDFTALGREVMQVFQYRAGKQNLRLEVDIPDLPLLMLDKQRIRQILLNLIGNAVKFTPSGSVTLQAALSGDADNSEFTFLVRDTGIGISPEDQNKLMEPFVQLSQFRGTNASNNGTGLGLAISKRLAEKMGGKLWLKSEPGKGSTFGATLYHVAVVEGKLPASSDSGTTPLPSPGENRDVSILLVDDVPMNLKVLAAICRKNGVEDLVSVNSGAAALEELKKRTFSMVFTDLWMPGMDGTELATRIRASEAFRKMPVLAVTADIEMKNCAKAGLFNGVLLKPITYEKIRTLLDDFHSGVWKEQTGESFSGKSRS